VFAGYIFVGQKSGDKAKGEKGGRALGRSLWWRVRAQPRRLFVGFACGLFFLIFQTKIKKQDETLDTSAKFQTKKKRLLLHFAPKKKPKKWSMCPPKKGIFLLFQLFPVRKEEYKLNT
jgi:hypothetical protein